MHFTEWVPFLHSRFAVALALGLLLALGLAYAAWGRGTAIGTVAKVFNGKSFVLQGGQVVRLASIQAPNAADGPKRAIKRVGEPLAEEATVALMRLVLKQKVRLVSGSQKYDRKKRLVAQAYLEDGTWIQGDLLRNGHVMVYSFADSREKLQDMLKLEATARASRRGIWALPYYRVLSAEEALEGLDRYRLVEGKILQVGETSDRTYLNFGPDKGKDFTVSIAKRDRRLFADMHLSSLKGKRVRVRGWIYMRGGPMIEATHPEQIEIIPAKARPSGT